jgi:hypothetical protein
LWRPIGTWLRPPWRKVRAWVHDHFGRRWRHYQWVFIGLLAVTALILGFIGFDRGFDRLGAPHTFGDKLYLALQLFVLESGRKVSSPPVALEIARLLAPLTALYAAVGALAGIFRGQLARLRARLAGRNHVLVCGLGRAGFQLATRCYEDGYPVLVIEGDDSNPSIQECRDRGISVLVGDATDRSLLRAAGVHRGQYLFAVSGDDGTNIEVALHAGAIADKYRIQDERLQCFVNVTDIGVRRRLGAAEGAPEFEWAAFDFFDFAERGAAAMLHDQPGFADEGVGRQPHLLILGAGQMGSNLVVHAARSWRLIRGAMAPRLPITVLAQDARARVDLLGAEYRSLTNLCTLTPKTCAFDEARKDDGSRLKELEPPVSHVYVCLGRDTDSWQAAIVLRDLLGSSLASIRVRTTERAAYGNRFRPRAHDGRPEIREFRLLDRTCSLEVLGGGEIDILARAVHEDYVRREFARARHTGARLDPGRTARWEELDEDIKESNREHARAIPGKLRDVGCRKEPLTRWTAEPAVLTPEEIEILARREHERWLAQRRTAGVTYGPVRDTGRKVNPNLLPWDDDRLGEEMREENRETARSLPAILARAGFAMVRL